MTHWPHLTPPFPAAGYAPLADSIAALLHTRNDVALVQGEAVVALEATASSLGRAGVRALNIVTSIYGRWFGAWLRRSGADVIDLVAEAGKPVTVKAVADALAQGRFDLVAVVHAESATGILNPLEQIAELTRAAGALLAVDAVASVGGHAFDVDALGVDIAVIGPQKALGGQAGVSALSISSRAWDRINRAGEAPSILSLADLKRDWIDAGRAALPGTPSALEFHALRSTLQAVEEEGLPAILARHARAARAARAGALALTGREWVDGADASNLVTAVALPDGVAPAQVLAQITAPTLLGAGVGPGGDRLLRLNHTGPRARPEVILGELALLSHAFRALGLPADPHKVLGAAVAAL